MKRKLLEGGLFQKKIVKNFIKNNFFYRNRKRFEENKIESIKWGSS